MLASTCETVAAANGLLAGATRGDEESFGMSLLRCPACDLRGEIPGHDPGGWYRCPRCDHVFLAGEAKPTQEHNLFAADSPAFLHEASADPGEILVDPRWQTWIARLAEYCRLAPPLVVSQALTQYASQNGFREPPPGL